MITIFIKEKNEECFNCIDGLNLFICMFTSSKKWSAIGGNGGTVKLAYEHGIFQQVEVDEKQAIELAKQRCKDWGYSDAKSFEELKKCISFGNYGCDAYQVTKDFQCINKKE